MGLTKVRGAGAEGLTLSSTSLTVANGLTLTDGDVTVASGHGLSFAATSDGTTMSSELLDDYEEGTWTAVLNSVTSTLSSANCHYVKIGRVVHIFGNIDVSSLDNSDGSSLSVGNVPFQASSAGLSHGSILRQYNKDELFPSTPATDATGIIVSTTNSFNVNSGAKTGTNPFITYTQLNSSGEFNFGATFLTD